MAAVKQVHTKLRKPADFATLTPAEQLLFRVATVMDGEMHNGGLDQYLRNGSGDDAQQVMADLERIGARGALDVLRTAAGWFDGGVIPTDRDARFDQLIAAEERDPVAFASTSEELSRQYLRTTPELYARLQEFVAQRPHEFPDSDARS
jgi:hypothetical protein